MPFWQNSIRTCVRVARDNETVVAPSRWSVRYSRSLHQFHLVLLHVPQGQAKGLGARHAAAAAASAPGPPEFDPWRHVPVRVQPNGKGKVAVAKQPQTSPQAMLATAVPRTQLM